MKKLPRAGLLFCLFVVLIVLGWIAPAYFISTGVQKPGEMQGMRRTAYYTAAGLIFDNPLSRLFVTAMRVDAVEYAPGHCKEYGGATTKEMDYRVLVRTYYVFGIPGRMLSVECGGTYLSLVRPEPDKR